MLICKLCQRTFRNFRNLGNHIYHSHKEITLQKYYTTYFGNNINVGKCKVCDSPTEFIGMSSGYKKTCSKECFIELNKKIYKSSKEKIIQTNLKRYGVEQVLQSSEIREKIIQTNLKRYGVEQVLQSSEIREKAKQTNLERYDVEHILQSNIYKENLKQICLKKYNTEHVMYSDEFKKKVKQTNLKKYGTAHPEKLKIFQEKAKQTNLEKFGVENVMQLKEIQEKIKQTNLEKYGVEYVMQSKEIQEKVKQTNLERYGVEYAPQLKEIREKVKQTNLEKYGVEYGTQSKEIQEKVKQTNLQNYYNKLLNSDRLRNLVKPLFSIEEYKGVNRIIENAVKSIKYPFQCTTCNTIFNDHLDNGHIPRCHKCFPIYTSKYETEIKDWLLSLNINTEHKNRSLIYPYELDIYIPQFNLAIEFNGLYWHNELYCDSKYHLNKTILCESKGVHLIHIFEDEWINKKDIVKSIIKSKLNMNNKIYAKDCKIRTVDNNIANKFLKDNYIHEYTSSKYNYGLYYNGELIYLISLYKGRYNRIVECNKIDVEVEEGLNILVEYIIREVRINNIELVVDRRYNNSNLDSRYWKYIRATDPNYYYIKNYIREPKYKYQKHKLQHIFPAFYNKDLTEYQIMKLAGYNKIWDVGNIVYSYNY